MHPARDCGGVREFLMGRPVLHGHARSKKGPQTAEYSCWYQMIRRCENPKSHIYKYYGGRGIGVCERWRHSFTNFLADMGMRPSPKHSIDRYPDNNSNYRPDNCRWATIQQQNCNRRTQFGDAQHCKRGHLLAGENLSIKKTGGRRCLACHRDKEAERRSAHKKRAL